MIRLTLLVGFILRSRAWISIHTGSQRYSRLATTPSEGDFDNVDNEPVSIDQYKLTTKSDKDLVFDEATGRFFETTLRRKSRHDVWQEFLRADTTEANTTEDSYSTAETTDMAFSNNEMVPTRSLSRTSTRKFQEETTADSEEECLLHVPYQDTCDTTMQEGDSDYDTGKREDISLEGEVREQSIVEDCYTAWNQRDMEAAAGCFRESFEYQDSQYLGKLTDRRELESHFAQQADLLPPGSQLVLDHIAEDQENGNIATQWHIERRDGSRVPYTKGVSFYTTKDKKIVRGFRVSEMLVKPNKDAVNRMISVVPSSFSQLLGNRPPAIGDEDTSRRPRSIIEEYFEAWNKRDMEAALGCFGEDCVYQTEDPVFVDTFVGKQALREHLEKNANALPPSCKILLDSIALDSTRGTIGTSWHLEVNGIAIPNLRGCSMYTTDRTTGLLKTGFDVTEAPVKLPRVVLPYLGTPAVALFDTS